MVQPQKEKYKRKEKIGAGAYGNAYLVQSQLTQKLWVIKKVEMKDMSYEERVKPRDEARILEVLHHPNIIQFKDVFKDSKMCLNVVMEYADNGELADEIKRRKNSGQSFSEEEILNYFT